MSEARILVVDDEPSQLAALRRVLRRSRYEVETAASGRIALRMVVASRPDLILLDVSMPRMSGHEFLRRLRRLEAKGLTGVSGQAETLPIPVIFLTALDAPHQIVSGLDAGAVDYVTKPYDAEELRARIRRQLRRHQGIAEQIAHSSDPVSCPAEE